MVFVQGALAIASKVGPNLFPLGRLIKVARSGYKITNSTNPLTVASNITLTVLECCAPPPLRLALPCVTFGVVLTSVKEIGQKRLIQEVYQITMFGL